MSRVADVVVIGGGVIGTSIAYALAQRKLGRVVLLEQDALASGASGRSMSVLRMHYTDEWDARLALASFPTFAYWPDLMGGPAVYTRTGFLNVVSPEDAPNLLRNVEILRRLGVNTRAVSADEVKQLQPGIHADDIGAAAWEPDGGYVEPVETVRGFARRARELGVEVREWTSVQQILLGESRVTGVATSAGQIGAPRVIVAAGAWTPRLCRPVGVDCFSRPKGIDVVAVTRPDDLSRPHVVFRDYIQGSTFRSEGAIQSIVGVPCFEWDLDPDTASSALPPTAPLDGARILTHRLPAMERAAFTGGYRAFDAYSGDRHAVLDRIAGLEGLYVATGFSGAGFKIAPAVGACVADALAGEPGRTVDISAFGLERFRRGTPLEGPYPYAPWKPHVEPGPAPRR